MSRLTIPTRDAAPAQSQPLLDAVFKKFGVIPNLFKVLGSAPIRFMGSSR